MSDLAGRRVLVTGVLTAESIAWTVAERLQRAGAEVLLTSFGRARSITERAAGQLPSPADVLELDVRRDEDFAVLAAELERRWEGLDGVVHAIAHAEAEAVGGGFLSTSAAAAQEAFRASAFSLVQLAQALAPQLRSGSSVVALGFDAGRAMPGYDWMGVAKTALEAAAAYLAAYLGPAGVRANVVAAGPLRTPSAAALPGFADTADRWAREAPLGWDPDDRGPVADAVLFLLSPAARAISGEVLHVDGGFHRALRPGSA